MQAVNERVEIHMSRWIKAAMIGCCTIYFLVALLCVVLSMTFSMSPWQKSAFLYRCGESLLLGCAASALKIFCSGYAKKI